MQPTPMPRAEGAHRARAPQGLSRVEPVPRPSLAALGGALSWLAHTATRPVRPHDLDARDEAFIDGVRPLMDLLYDAYFTCETELEAEIPEGPVLVVANHNGMTGTPDMFCHMTAFWRRYGTQRVAYGLMHDLPFSIPAAGAWLNAAGAVAAGHDTARRAFDRGAAVLVFPGGDRDACKPYSERYRVDFGEHRGFLRLAIRAGVPIVPVVSVGGHESLFVWSDGQAIARALHLHRRFRTRVAPIGVALPYGLIAGVAAPHLPPPVKVHTRILAPLELGLPRSAAEDDAAVEDAYRRVISPMRQAMEALRAAGRHGLFPRGGRR